MTINPSNEKMSKFLNDIPICSGKTDTIFRKIKNDDPFVIPVFVIHSLIHRIIIAPDDKTHDNSKSFKILHSKIKARREKIKKTL
uniref:Preprotein translocase subunit Y n=1 Tax=Heterosigma akashiwo TaxID=2829 RepID=A0A224AMA9_HETAK|nr:preprotein translocase subunit Y [Heterosigma akashiwo]BBA18381.1 preprotein translocase subunit Y [Heterosigma akashiwo]BBA18520.1 preprotein translocase subunit Y [Heterosigma akashiwo]BBA18797.1 preprotein translocase subunit Y [Heterosigma akashiwo]